MQQTNSIDFGMGEASNRGFNFLWMPSRELWRHLDPKIFVDDWDTRSRGSTEDYFFDLTKFDKLLETYRCFICAYLSLSSYSYTQLSVTSGLSKPSLS
jgi:hypothetical protein